MKIDTRLKPASLRQAIDRFLETAIPKTDKLARRWDPSKGSPVITRRGRYQPQGWTEWTQGFQYGIEILLYEATGEKRFLERGREHTRLHMAPHVSHTGVHDHGFNNVSTYGNLRRLALEGRSEESREAMDFYELALKVSGAVQAARWTVIHDGSGFIHSFNGPQSLFSDTIRSCRSLVLAHRLGHRLMAEGDRSHSLLDRALQHLDNTCRYNVYYGKGRDSWDTRGRVVHESIFNPADGAYRCPSTQQGYSPFSTWTRGLAWILAGAPEQMEFIATLDDQDPDLEKHGGKRAVLARLRKAAEATADFYIENTARDGIPYWDTGAPGLAHMPDHLDKPSRPDNPHEPVDSSAAAIAAQGLLRLGRLLGPRSAKGRRYFLAGLSVARSLFLPPYLSEDPAHEGLLLHSIYHRPRGWDHIPKGKAIPQGESSMWGDYHAMELALLIQREIEGAPWLRFFGPDPD